MPEYEDLDKTVTLKKKNGLRIAYIKIIFTNHNHMKQSASCICN